MDKDLCLAEIQQLHNAVSDFSHQSISIKKLSITIYIAFLSIYFGFQGSYPNMPKIVFFLIGILIPVFCYIYEIYIDYTRQRLRARMNNLCSEYENFMGLPARGKKSVRAKIPFFDFDRISHKHFSYIKIFLRKKSNKVANSAAYYYINLLHCMYIIYLMEIAITIVTGCLWVS